MTSLSSQFDTQEVERLLIASEVFEKEASRRFPDRPCLTTVIDINGKTVFVTRFIRPLNPPQELLDAFPSSPQETAVRPHTHSFCLCHSFSVVILLILTFSLLRS